MDIEEAKSRLAEVSSDGVVFTAAGSRMVFDAPMIWCNAALLRETGYARDEVIGASPTLFHGPLTCTDTVAQVAAAVRQGRPTRARLLNYRKDGSSFWTDLTTSLIKTADGKPHYWISVQRNVTQYVEMEQRLASAQNTARKAQDRLWEAINALPDAFVLYDDEDRVVLFNDQYRQIYSKSASAIRPGVRFKDILREGLANGQYLEAVGREEEWLRERLKRHRDPGGPVEQSLPGGRFLQVREVRLSNGDTVGFRTDITMLKRQQRELEIKATELEIAARTDPLTGLLNRRGLDAAMDAARAESRPHDRFAVLHVDLDRFKPINDVFGHRAGDHLLCVVATILKMSTRKDDLVARVGGDEFVIFQNGRTSEQAAVAVADRIRAACGKPVNWNGKQLLFGCSIGISTGTREQLGDLLLNADIALYEAKFAGRGRSHLFTPELRRTMQEKKRLSDELLEGLKRGEFIAHYQPQIRAADYALTGVEALVRWQNPKRGLLMPDMFLPVSEELGMLAEIDARVMAHAEETLHVMADAGLPLSGLSVNVSLARLATLADLDTVRGYAGLPAKISFELLEAIDFDDEINEVSWIIDALRDLGIAIELDDFGSGRASLTSLLALRPDRIKIDRKIVSSALFDRAGAGSMVRAIAEMCHGLQIPMTAEGIETASHATLMRDLGCDRLQGFFFSRPLTRAALVDFARDWAEKHKTQNA